MVLHTLKHMSLIAGFIAMISLSASAVPKSFNEVNEGYKKVVSTIDGQTPLFELWANRKDNQLLA